MRTIAAAKASLVYYMTLKSAYDHSYERNIFYKYLAFWFHPSIISYHFYLRFYRAHASRGVLRFTRNIM